MSWARDTDEEPPRWSETQAAYQVSREIRNRQAVRVVAGHATDLGDCTELLAMLGLDPHAGRPDDELDVSRPL